ncbi:flagellin N-terminal helical domain-containing protein [Yoonia sp.]|uniref:flagellin N-terminal helical domain-containing protein n=1 Tax=Yoonia sp. TaxID=2212373 RepID=UPI00404863B2
MALAIATNTGALMAAASATSVNRDMETSMERLSTGKRINSAKDDAAGVAIASRLTSEIRGTNQAIRNAQNGQALINTAEGAHKEVENILQRMRELATQAANDTNDSTDRANLGAEMTQLTTEIDRIAAVTTWAGQSLLNGTGTTSSLASLHSSTADFSFQVGAGTSTKDSISVAIGALTAEALGIGGVSSAPVVTSSVTAAATSGAIAETNAGSVVTISGDFNNADTYTMEVNGLSKTITASNADQYEDNASGIAAQMRDAFEADITAAVTAINAGTPSANNLRMAGVSIAQTGGALTFTQANMDTSATVTTSPGLNTIATTDTSATTSTITITSVGTFAASDAYSVEINGESVSYTATAGDGFDNAALAGHAAGLAAAITNNADLKAAGYSATSSAGVITVSRTALDFESLSTTATGGAATLTAGGGDFYITAGASSSNTNTLTAASGAGTLTIANSTPAIGDVFTATINGKDISYTATSATAADQATGLAAAISADVDLTAQGYSATASGVVVQLARDDAGTFTVGGNIDSGDVFSMTIAGTTVTATISTADGYSDDVSGAASQVAQAIKDANISGLTVIDNGDGSFQLRRFGSVDITSATGATSAIEAIDAAIQTVNSQRANLGAVSNRMDNTVSNLTNVVINLEGGRGRIEDADFAAESTALSKAQILQQASTAMLAQANASKQSVLSLLQG